MPDSDLEEPCRLLSCPESQFLGFFPERVYGLDRVTWDELPSNGLLEYPEEESTALVGGGDTDLVRYAANEILDV